MKKPRLQLKPVKQDNTMLKSISPRMKQVGAMIMKGKKL